MAWNKVIWVSCDDEVSGGWNGQPARRCALSCPDSQATQRSAQGSIFRAVEGNLRPAIGAKAETFARLRAGWCSRQPLERQADRPQLLGLEVGQGKVDLAVVPALRRVVTVLQQHLARMFGPGQPAVVVRQGACRVDAGAGPGPLRAGLAGPP
jgi:hypothetical protein